MKKLLKQIACMLTAVLVTATSVPVYAAPQATSPIINIDGTLAVPPVFLVSQYAKLNPETAKIFNNNPQLMYNYYMHTGIYQGQRCFDTKTPTTVENLFLYMSMNRQTYIKNAQKKSFKYFNLANYMSQNPELAIVFANNKILWMYHYINFGIYEGRSCGTNSDPVKVIALNPALAVLNNPTFSPDKIMANYATITGSTDTTMLANVYNANGDLAKVLALNNVNLNPAATASSGGSSSSSCDHKFEYVSIDGEGKHKKVCEKCGYVGKEENHSYKVDSQTDGNNNTVHVLKCEKCNHKHREAHIDKNYDDICDVCGYKMDHIHHFVIATPVIKNSTSHLVECKGCGDIIYTPHTFKYTASVAPTKNNHTVMCECGYSKGEAHTFVNGKCKVCGYSVSEHEHTITYTQNDDGITHNGHCTYEGCTYTVTKEACVYDSTGYCGKCHRACAHAKTKIEHINGTTQHQTVCIICGKVLDTANCQYDKAHKCTICKIECPHPSAQCKITAIDSTGHSVKCKACGAAITKKEAHNVVYQDTKDGLTHRAVCEDCGFVVIATEEHNFEYEYAGNDKHNSMCKECGYINRADDCTYVHGVCKFCDHACEHVNVKYVSNDNGTHKKVCNICSHDVGEEACALTYLFVDDTEHNVSCELCSYHGTLPHGNFEYIPNNDGTHKKICADCRGTTVLRAACTFDSNSKCTVCGYECDHSAGEGYVDNGDGTHTLKCSVCNKANSEPAAHNPVYSDIEGEDGHKITCRECGAVITAQEAHDYEYVYIGNNKHKEKCKHCNHVKTEEEACEFEDGICVKCEYECPHTGATHAKKNAINPDAHDIICNNCSKVLRSENHNISYSRGNADNTHKGECTVCGEEIIPETACSYDTYESKGTEGHAAVCTVCGITSTTMAHNMGNFEFDENAYTSDGKYQHKSVCNDCGYSVVADCSPATNPGDVCTTCNHKVATYKYKNYYNLNESLDCIKQDASSSEALPLSLDSHLTYLENNLECSAPIMYESGHDGDEEYAKHPFAAYAGDDNAWYTAGDEIPMSRTFTIAYKDEYNGESAATTLATLVNGKPIKVKPENCASEEAAKNIAKTCGLVFVRYEEGVGAFFTINHGNPNNVIEYNTGANLELNVKETP